MGHWTGLFVFLFYFPCCFVAYDSTTSLQFKLARDVSKCNDTHYRHCTDFITNLIKCRYGGSVLNLRIHNTPHCTFNESVYSCDNGRYYKHANSMMYINVDVVYDCSVYKCTYDLWRPMTFTGHTGGCAVYKLFVNATRRNTCGKTCHTQLMDPLDKGLCNLTEIMPDTTAATGTTARLQFKLARDLSNCDDVNIRDCTNFITDLIRRRYGGTISNLTIHNTPYCTNESVYSCNNDGYYKNAKGLMNINADVVYDCSVYKLTDDWWTPKKIEGHTGSCAVYKVFVNVTRNNTCGKNCQTQVMDPLDKGLCNLTEIVPTTAATNGTSAFPKLTSKPSRPIAIDTGTSYTHDHVLTETETSVSDKTSTSDHTIHTSGSTRRQVIGTGSHSTLDHVITGTPLKSSEVAVSGTTSTRGRTIQQTQTKLFKSSSIESSVPSSRTTSSQIGRTTTSTDTNTQHSGATIPTSNKSESSSTESRKVTSDAVQPTQKQSVHSNMGSSVPRTASTTSTQIGRTGIDIQSVSTTLFTGVVTMSTSKQSVSSNTGSRKGSTSTGSSAGNTSTKETTGRNDQSGSYAGSTSTKATTGRNDQSGSYAGSTSTKATTGRNDQSGSYAGGSPTQATTVATMGGNGQNSKSGNNKKVAGSSLFPGSIVDRGEADVNNDFRGSDGTVASMSKHLDSFSTRSQVNDGPDSPKYLGRGTHSTTPKTSSLHGKSPIGTIIGSLLGVLGAIGLLVAGTAWHRHRKNKRKVGDGFSSIGQSFNASPKRPDSSSRPTFSYERM